MSATWHYDETPLPVGNPVNADGSNESYQLGFYDGALYAKQYADEPEDGVLFMSPEGAKAWLAAAIAVLTPYIETGDRFIRVRRALVRSDRCMRCPYPLDHHTTVHLRGEIETHCPYCSCSDCPDPDDFDTTRRTR